jgi:hypothetical protein
MHADPVFCSKSREIGLRGGGLQANRERIIVIARGLSTRFAGMGERLQTPPNIKRVTRGQAKAEEIGIG